jgi:hypothetical protein
LMVAALLVQRARLIPYTARTFGPCRRTFAACRDRTSRQETILYYVADFAGINTTKSPARENP